MNSTSLDNSTSSILLNSTLSFILDFATNASTTTTTPPLSASTFISNQTTAAAADNSQTPSASLLQSIPSNSQSSLPLECTPTFSPATSILFQLSHILLLAAYLTPTNVLYLPGATGQLAMHTTLALGHLLLTVWIYTSGPCYRVLFPTLIGWSAAFLLINALRAAVLLYSQLVKGRLTVKEVAALYETLFAPIRAPKHDFSKLIAKGRLLSLAIGESYAVEGVTETNRLALLVAGKINVMCAGQFLHSINPGEFLDSPEWESSAPPGTSSLTGTSSASAANNNCNGATSKPSGAASGTSGRKASLSNNLIPVSTAGRYELFDGTTGKTGKEQFQAEVQQRFNISLVAASVNVQYVLWERPTLEYHLAKEPYMANVMGLLLARDITNKLYQMNEKFSNERGSQIDIRLPVIINSFSKRTDLTKFLPVTSSSASASTSARPRSLTATVRETPKATNVPKTPAAAISPLATTSTSSSSNARNRPSIEDQMAAASSLAISPENTTTINNYKPPLVCQQSRESPATTCSPTRTTTEHSSSDEIFIDIGKSSPEEATPVLELKEFSVERVQLKQPEDSNSEEAEEEEEDEEDEEEEEENSTSASYAAMSLSDTGSNWAALGSRSESRSSRLGHKKLLAGVVIQRSADSTAVHIPLLPKSVTSRDKHRYY